MQVEELSLVDNPAVPDATWVIAKRLHEEDTPEMDEQNTAPRPASAGEQNDSPANDEPVATAGQASQAQTPVSKDHGQPSGTDAPGADSRPSGQPLAKSRQAVGAAFADAIATLREVAGQMDDDALHRLSRLLEFSRIHYADVPRVAAELNKSAALEPGKHPVPGSDDAPGDGHTAGAPSGETLSAENIAAIVAKTVEETLDKKCDTVPDDSTSTPTGDQAPTQQPPAEPAQPAEPARTRKASDGDTAPRQTGSPSLLSEASELLASRQAEQATKTAADAEARAVARINEVAKRFAASMQRAEELGQKVHKATGAE